MQHSSTLEGKIPVFAFPVNVEFYLEDHKTYMRLVTLYNPYDFQVHFKVLCTAPDKYEVSTPEGRLKPKTQIDLAVRHKAVTPANCNVTDKFRIQMQDSDSKQIIGKKEILATLHSGRPPNPGEDDNNSMLSSDRTAADWKLSRLTNESTTRDCRDPLRSSTNSLVWLTGVICFICLLLPNEGEPSPLNITVPHNLKLVFSYLLGLVTMVIFRH